MDDKNISFAQFIPNHILIIGEKLYYYLTKTDIIDQLVINLLEIDKYIFISCRFSPEYFKHKYRIVWRKIENVQRINEINHRAV